MRVIGGNLRGRKLTAFESARVRPTTDRVRESIFNIIAPFLPRERVLDLYAGTGAMGIEALSRGVKEAHFVENNSASVKVIEKNIEALDLQDRAKIIKQDVAGFLDSSGTNEAQYGPGDYDLLFIDPPYSAGLSAATLEKVAASNALINGAIVVVEAGKREPISDEILEKGFTGLTQIDFRKYGDSLIYIFKKDD